MTNLHFKPHTPIDQAEIIPFRPKLKQPPKTWEEQLTRAFNKNPKNFESLVIYVYWAFADLPAEILFKRCFEDMRFLEKNGSRHFKLCIDNINEGYKKIYCSEEAEVLPLDNFQGQEVTNESV